MWRSLVDLYAVAVRLWNDGTIHHHDSAGHSLCQVLYGGGDYGIDEPHTDSAEVLSDVLRGER